MDFQCTAALLTLAVENVEAIAQFYSQLLGQAPSLHTPQVYAEFQLPGLRLGIFRPRAAHQDQFQSTSGSMSLCLEVDDLEGAIAHLTQLGQPPPSSLQNASHGQEIYAYDPAGNRLILHQST